jgi:hypothetical protein
MRVQKPLERRLQERIRVTDNGCWEWLLCKNRDGYGRWVVDGREWKAHRLAYTLYRGEIADGLEIDHLCRNRCCCNPDHLEVVTHTVNIRRGESLPAKNRRKDRCVRGHEFTAENTAVDSQGWRSCLTCRREARAQWKADNPERFREIQREAVRRHRLRTADARREAAALRAEKRRAFCRNGHPRTPENTYVYPGGTAVCLPCRQAKGLLLNVP